MKELSEQSVKISRGQMRPGGNLGQGRRAVDVVVYEVDRGHDAGQEHVVLHGYFDPILSEVVRHHVEEHSVYPADRGYIPHSALRILKQLG